MSRSIPSFWAGGGSAITVLVIALLPLAAAVAEIKKVSIQQTEIGTSSRYNGWDYLVTRLRAMNIPKAQLDEIYGSSHMPPFTFIPFSVRPRESSTLYTSFLNQRNYRTAAAFARIHGREFAKAERLFGVPREVVTAILFIETQLGTYTGDHQVLHRLSRLAGASEPMNVERNYRRLRQEDPSVTFEAVRDRARYLEKTFLPEIPALIKIGERNRINVLRIRGSIAGAFGLPQFLPSAYLKFGVDGNRDGMVSLFNEVDALWSTTKYLANFGYKRDLPIAKRREAIWHYNHSDAYVDAVLTMADGIARIPHGITE